MAKEWDAKMGSDHDQIEAILIAALEIPSEKDREDFLAQACGDNQELRSQVDQLINNHFQAGEFLADFGKTGDSSQRMPADFGDDDRTGQVLGPYRLARLVGKGGMGAVYFAEQETPIRRPVAVKVIRHGFVSKGTRTRFEHERLTLSLMDHPNIARVVDAGSTPDGSSFIVMEWVDGVDITVFCDQQRYTIPQRVKLLAEVCQAVQHAHQKGIIHRDLKPSNVLVALKDGKAVPKVIDFGVARAIDSHAFQQERVTEAGQIIGTIEYMAPEQADSNNLDVDTRCDVYGLGGLLYELLAGSPPIDQVRLRNAGMFERLRLIREYEPIRPSERCATSSDSVVVAANRQTMTTNLRRMIANDLDWITMKCLEKDRNRRYETANELFQDLQRYLEGQPVSAGPPSIIYQLRKFALRNRALLGAALSVALLVSVTAWVGTWQAIRLGHLHQQSEENLKQANQNLDLAISVVDRFCTQVSDDLRLKEQDLRPLRLELLSSAAEYQTQLIALRKHSGAARVDLARAHRRLGELSKEIEANDKAVDFLRVAVAEYEQLMVEEGSSSSTYQLELATCYQKLAEALYYSGKHGESQLVADQSVELAKKLLESDEESKTYRMTLADGHLLQCFAAFSIPQSKNREEFARLAVDQYSLLVANYPDDAEVLERLAKSYSRLGRSIRLSSLTRWREAETALYEAADFARAATQHAGHKNSIEAQMAEIVGDLGEIALVTERIDEADKLLSEAIEILEQLLRNEPSVWRHRSNLAIMHIKKSRMHHFRKEYIDEGVRLKSAIDLLESWVTMAPNDLVAQSNFVDALGRFAEVMVRRGDYDEARVRIDHAIELAESGLRQAPDYKGLVDIYPTLFERRAELEITCGRIESAILNYDRAIELQKFSAIRARYRIEKSQSLFQLGEHQKAIDEIRKVEGDLVQGIPQSAATRLQCARKCTGFAEKVKSDIGLSDERRMEIANDYAVLAIEFLKRMVESGDQGTDFLKDTPELEPLRSREDFNALLK